MKGKNCNARNFNRRQVYTEDGFIANKRHSGSKDIARTLVKLEISIFRGNGFASRKAAHVFQRGEVVVLECLRKGPEKEDDAALLQQKTAAQKGSGNSLVLPQLFTAGRWGGSLGNRAVSERGEGVGFSARHRRGGALERKAAEEVPGALTGRGECQTLA